MPRRRLAVVLLLGGQIADEVDGLRRALGDSQLGRIGPHVTLAPPANADEDGLAAALAGLRAASAHVDAPVDLELGPLDTFHPANTVLFLSVGSSVALAELADACLVGPFDRPRERDFVPHVTVCLRADAEDVAPAVRVLAGYRRSTRVDRLTLMELRTAGDGQRWEPLADAVFGGVSSVTAGPRELRLWTSTLVDPEAADALDLDPDAVLGRGAGDGLVVTARTAGDDRVVGVAVGRRRGRRASVLRGVLVSPEHRGVGVARRLVDGWERAATAGGATRSVAPDVVDEVAGLLAHLGWGRTEPILDRRYR